MAFFHRAFNTTGHISQLSDDILWYIFNRNTPDDDLFRPSIWWHRTDDNSLITARHTSQVCANWRTILLSSSSIWANSLNFVHLNQETDIWRNEVLARTGTAHLSVQINLLPYSNHHNVIFDTTLNFICSLLTNHIIRIRRLSVRKYSTSIYEHQEMWTFLQLPAPNLEICEIECVEDGSFHRIARIFSNDAPKLHTLTMLSRTEQLCYVRFNTLRYLNLQFLTIGRDILFALAVMKQLEKVEIREDTDIDPEEYTPINHLVRLPSLKFFSLEQIRAPSMLNLLRNITPTPATKIKVSFFLRPDPLQVGQDLPYMRDLLAAFSSHIRSFIKHVPVHTISITIMYNRYISVHISSEIHPDQGFEITVEECLEPIQPAPLYRCIFSNALIAFRNIKKLEIDVDDWETNVLRTPDHRLMSFLYALENVETLNIQTDILEKIMLVEKMNPDRVLFPRLRGIGLTTFGDGDQSFVLIQFIIRRRKAGRPIQHVDLSKCDHFGAPENMDRLLFLEFSAGISVIWGTLLGKRLEEL